MQDFLHPLYDGKLSRKPHELSPFCKVSRAKTAMMKEPRISG